MIYRVRWNFDRAQPRWTAPKIARFGERNKGFTIEAEDQETAKRLLEQQFRLNPFYLTVEQESHA